MRFGDFRTKIRNLIWPDTEAENLVAAHDNLFQEAMAEIQKWVPEERDLNVDVIPFCATHFKCGRTIVACPRGRIAKVFTIANDNWCDPVFCRQAEAREPEDWSRNYLRYTSPADIGLPVLPLGYRQAEASTDFKWGRARTAIWAIVDRNIEVAPWLQSNEVLVIAWAGVKDEWKDDDIVPDRIDFRKVVKLYVAFAHQRDFGSDRNLLASAKAFYDDALADLIWEWKEFTRRRTEPDFPGERDRTAAEIKASALPDVSPATTPVGLAVIGSYGSQTSAALAVQAMVNAWAPDLILTTGNNSYSGNYDTDVGAPFHGFIKPYSGVHGSGADANAFWPCLGAHDVANLAAYQAFFTLPNNERYYEICLGAAQFFFLDADSTEPDGFTSASIQGQWLQAKLLLSPAPWKIVVMGKSPFSSSATGSNVFLQWPFKSWGADLVISGGAVAYERLLVGGLPYLVNGPGGNDLGAAGAPASGSVFYYGDKNGALKGSLSATALSFSFYNEDGALIDTLTLTQ